MSFAFFFVTIIENQVREITEAIDKQRAEDKSISSVARRLLALIIDDTVLCPGRVSKL